MTTTQRISWQPKQVKGRKVEDNQKHRGDVVGYTGCGFVVIDDADFFKKIIRADHVVRVWKGNHKNANKSPKAVVWGKGF